MRVPPLRLMIVPDSRVKELVVVKANAFMSKVPLDTMTGAPTENPEVKLTLALVLFIFNLALKLLPNLLSV